ncbi:MAG TPA: glycosyltransferase family 2 protein [bacterium]|nr:glycosyltransferase family 2 protein [bacterium]
MLKLSIIIPTYNEEKTVLKIINRVERVKLENINKEIIIVDDGSTDQTKEILKPLEEKYKIIYQPKNLGKGAAVRTALNQITGDIVLIQDADLEYNPEEYSKLLDPIINHDLNVVYGSRMLGAHTATNFYYYLGNKLITFIANLLYNASLTDIETGYKVFRKDVIINLNLTANGFDIEPEITAQILKKYNIHEVPISYFGRDFSEGKKISWRDGLQAILVLLKYKFIN